MFKTQVELRTVGEWFHCQVLLQTIHVAMSQSARRNFDSYCKNVHVHLYDFSIVGFMNLFVLVFLGEYLILQDYIINFLHKYTK